MRGCSTNRRSVSSRLRLRKRVTDRTSESIQAREVRIEQGGSSSAPATVGCFIGPAAYCSRACRSAILYGQRALFLQRVRRWRYPVGSKLYSDQMTSSANGK